MLVEVVFGEHEAGVFLVGSVWLSFICVVDADSKASTCKAVSDGWLE